MSKPIFVVRVPNVTGQAGLMGVRSKLDSKIDDYHVIIVPFDGEEFEFESFCVTNADDITIEEFKNKVNKLMDEYIKGKKLD